MNTALVCAAGLILALGAVHSILGERYILSRLFRRSDLPRLFGSDLFTRRTLRFAWHLTTLAWLGFAALLLAAARPGSGTLALRQIGALVAATSLDVRGLPRPALGLDRFPHHQCTFVVRHSLTP